MLRDLNTFLWIKFVNLSFQVIIVRVQAPNLLYYLAGLVRVLHLVTLDCLQGGGRVFIVVGPPSWVSLGRTKS